MKDNNVVSIVNNLHIKLAKRDLNEIIDNFIPYIVSITDYSTPTEDDFAKFYSFIIAGWVINNEYLIPECENKQKQDCNDLMDYLMPKLELKLKEMQQ